MNRVIVGLLIMLTCNYLQADDLTLPKDFKAGDVVSADTFNQVFRAIESPLCQHRCRVYFLDYANIRGRHSSDLCRDTVKVLESKQFKR